MKFTYSRTIRFADTDAAGVVYFANYLSICHEAYEEALESVGIELHDFFSQEGVIIPISNARADYLRPMRCGDRIEVDLSASQVKEDTFFIEYEIWLADNHRKLAAQAKTAHVCVDSTTRKRTPLPETLRNWIQGKGPEAAEPQA
jgi:1,4-dihydroxy-2-naphthoyl-CoA hydrolase